MREKWKTPAGTAALGALAGGFFTHLFGLVTILHNYDDIAQQPRGYGAGVTSGRWLLSLLGDLMDLLGGNYNLPLINGLLFLILIALAAGLMVRIFEIRSPALAGLMGVMLAVFPSACATLVFRYTSVYYGLGIVLAVLAAWAPERYRLGWLLSALFTACSLGIYQAYVPITITIFVLRLLQLSLSLRKTLTLKDLVLLGLRFCGALLLGLGLYFLLMKATLALYGTQLSDYQGVNQMGVISLANLPKLVKNAYYMFLMTPRRDFWGIVSTKTIKILYFLTQCLSAGMVLFLLYKCRGVRSLFACLMCLLLPAAVCFVVIMCPESYIYTLMIYSFALMPCVPAILLTCFDETPVHRGRKAVVRGTAALLAAMCLSYGYQTNVNYTALYYSNRQIENYVSGLVTQVRMTEGFDAQKKWAFLGVIEDPLLSCYWEYELDCGGMEFTGPMLKRYSWDSWIWNYCGYMPDMASDEEIAALFDTEEVRAMPCWPDAGSIQVIGDTVVVKFSNTNMKPN